MWNAWALLGVLLAAAPVVRSDRRVVLVGEDGRELVRGHDTILVGVSDPRPTVRLDTVSVSDVVQLPDGQLRVRLSGDVMDAVADIVPDGKADITSITVEEQSVPVLRVPEPPSPTRPFAFRGRFSAAVTFQPISIPEIVLVEAENALGSRGVAAFDILFETDFKSEEYVWTGNDPLGKFFDPFTVAMGTLGPEAADEVVLFQGLREPQPQERRLRESGLATLVFEGVTPELGQARLEIQGLPLANPDGRRSVLGRFDSRELSIIGEEERFLETKPGSGVFRSVARRLPSNQVLELALPPGAGAANPGALALRVGSWQAFTAELVADQYKATLPELGDAAVAPAAHLRPIDRDRKSFTGDVAGLGRTRVVLSDLEEGRLVVLLTSSTLGLQDFHLELVGRAPTFRTLAIGPERLQVRPLSVKHTVSGIRMSDVNRDPGRFQPVWAMSTDSAPLAPGDYGEASGMRFELTTEPLAPGAPPRARFRVPLLLAGQVTRPGLINVVEIPEARPRIFEPRQGFAFEPASLLEQLDITIRRTAAPMR